MNDLERQNNFVMNLIILLNNEFIKDNWAVQKNENGSYSGLSLSMQKNIALNVSKNILNIPVSIIEITGGFILDEIKHFIANKTSAHQMFYVSDSGSNKTTTLNPDGFLSYIANRFDVINRIYQNNEQEDMSLSVNKSLCLVSNKLYNLSIILKYSYSSDNIKKNGLSNNVLLSYNEELCRSVKLYHFNDNDIVSINEHFMSLLRHEKTHNNDFGLVKNKNNGVHFDINVMMKNVKQYCLEYTTIKSELYKELTLDAPRSSPSEIRQVTKL